MKINRSVLIAGGVAAAVVVYFGVRTLMQPAPERAPQRPPEAVAAEAAAQAPRVVVRDMAAVPRQATLTLRGRTDAARVVVARAETSGLVQGAAVAEGAFVRAGQPLCTLDPAARAARVAEAQAQVQARELDASAAKELFDRGFRSETQVFQTRAALDAARASLAQARIEMDKLVIRAPFAGVFNRRDAEVGDFLSPGGACGEVVELDPLLITAQASEQEVVKLKVGAPAQARLATGQTLEGRIRFVSRTADPQTRTYRVEMAARNPGAAVAAGVTADLRTAVGVAPAHKLPPSILALNDAGQIGVRIVAADSTARFAPVSVDEESPDGLWVLGLPERARVIVVGAQYVADGQRVQAVAENPPAPRPPAATPVAAPAQGARAG